MTPSWPRRSAARGILGLLSLAILMAPCRVLAAPAPSDAVKKFFKAVASRDYVASWNLFTTNSRKIIANTLARHDKVTPAEIQKQFASNDKRMLSEFWEPFRTSSRATDLTRSGTFIDGRHNGKVAEVIVTLGARRAQFITLQEGADWKLAWMEQIIARQRARQKELQQQKASPHPTH